MCEKHHRFHMGSPQQRHILTSANFERMTILRPIERDKILSCAANSIMRDLLQQLETKTLLVVDEHGALLAQDPPAPKKHAILNPLMQLAASRGSSKGARVVLTGTAHAKFEREYVKSDMWHWLEYVTPLSDTVFDKLLLMNTILSRATIKDQVKEITNRVPREIVNMAAHIRQEISKYPPLDNNRPQSIQALSPMTMSCPK
ncbi:MAG: hypothetical protein J3Q66DRAFT_91820 [Benniella sp.]|nr:MAG: hypothetical protein J3Q66DRAFT_91820 [Benniella sp.]